MATRKITVNYLENTSGSHNKFYVVAFLEGVGQRMKCIIGYGKISSSGQSWSLETSSTGRSKLAEKRNKKGYVDSDIRSAMGPWRTSLRGKLAHAIGTPLQAGDCNWGKDYLEIGEGPAPSPAAPPAKKAVAPDTSWAGDW